MAAYKPFARLVNIRTLAGLLATALLSFLELPAVTQVQAPETVPELSREAAESAASKLRQIQEGSLSGHAFGLVRISEAEANSYLHYEMASEFPPGVSKARLKFEPGRPHGSAEVDFDKIKEGLKTPPNSFLDYFLRGNHTLVVDGTLAGSGEVGQFHLEAVTLDGIWMPRMVVDYLIEHYLKPRYPDVAIDRPFALPFSIEKFSVETGSVVISSRP